jgi:hypothetical protein
MVYTTCFGSCFFSRQVTWDLCCELGCESAAVRNELTLLPAHLWPGNIVVRLFSNRKPCQPTLCAFSTCFFLWFCMTPTFNQLLSLCSILGQALPQPFFCRVQLSVALQLPFRCCPFFWGVLSFRCSFFFLLRFVDVRGPGLMPSCAEEAWELSRGGAGR